MFTYLIVLAWAYVALMMAVAEAAHPTGTLLGAIITFLLYGVGPIALVAYLLGRPARRRARERAAAAAARESTASGVDPDARGEAPADPVPTVRKEP